MRVRVTYFHRIFLPLTGYLDALDVAFKWHDLKFKRNEIPEPELPPTNRMMYLVSKAHLNDI